MASEQPEEEKTHSTEYSKSAFIEGYMKDKKFQKSKTICNKIPFGSTNMIGIQICIH
jgi:hypothetical protein